MNLESISVMDGTYEDNSSNEVNVGVKCNLIYFGYT